ncbi:hypothetical protein BZA70DRAFT_285437 [Myxozyma melibiosi]|uniref:GDP/GTP exchange factor Sec2 N-terminal domain-containing protein n=1 Tax=Myxozyma melibiosi TaxID=54550 RepID=A0ABR1EYA6_9ASCO
MSSHRGRVRSPSPLSSASSAASSRRTSFQSAVTSASTVFDPGPGALAPVQMPTRLPSQPSSVQIYDTLEKEQEAIVNRLQRELSLLREEQTQLAASAQQRARSPIAPSPRHRRTDSSSSSLSITRAGAPVRSDSDQSSAQIQRRSSSRRSVESGSGLSSADDMYLASLRKENDALKRKLADMAKALGDKENELEALRATLDKIRIDSESAVAD